MARPCKHTTILEAGKPFEKGICRICWLYFNDEKCRLKWDDIEIKPRNTGGQIKSAEFRFTGERNCKCKEGILPESGIDKSEKKTRSA